MSSYPGNGNGNGVEWPHEQLTAALQEQPKELPANANWRDAALALSTMFVQDHELKKATVQALYFLKAGYEGTALDIKRVLEWQRDQERAHKGLDKRVAQNEVQLPTKIAKEVREQIADAREATKPDVPRPMLRLPGQKPTALLPEVRDRAPSYSQIDDPATREELQKLAQELVNERHKVELREAAIAARDDLLREQAQEAEKEKREHEAEEHARAEEKRKNDELDLKKSGERRAWLAAKIAAATVVGGGIWQVLHAFGVIK